LAGKAKNKKMECRYCKAQCIKVGIRSNSQRYYCKPCIKYQQEQYKYKAYEQETDKEICEHIKEGCGVRSIARLLHISPTTVIKRTKRLAKQIVKPVYHLTRKNYEMDELRTYIRNKTNRYWVAYAIRKDTKEVVDFKVGKRNKGTLRRVIDTLLLSEAKKIYTDGYPLYRTLIPPELHRRSKYKINHIERKNLSIRTHLKRLSRKTICFSKSIVMLEACLKIYFWG